MLSIITINLNNLDGLQRTFESVFCQTDTNYEYIVIDGGSIDGSIDVIKKYEGKISYWVSEPDKGIYNAMNKGISKATGEYCLFLNSGDYLYDSEVLNKVFAIYRQEDIVYGNLMIDKGSNTSEGRSPEKLNLNHLMVDTLWHPVSFIKRDLFEKYGYYDESFKIAGDYDFFLRAFTKGCSLYYIDTTISVFNTFGLSSKDEFIALTKEERAKSQKVHLKPEVLEMYCELKERILILENTNQRLRNNYEELLHSKAYICIQFMRRIFGLGIIVNRDKNV